MKVSCHGALDFFENSIKKFLKIRAVALVTPCTEFSIFNAKVDVLQQQTFINSVSIISSCLSDFKLSLLTKIDTGNLH